MSRSGKARGPGRRSGVPKKSGTTLLLSMDRPDSVVYLAADGELRLIRVEGEWCYVETATGTRGYVRYEQVAWEQPG